MCLYARLVVVVHMIIWFSPDQLQLTETPAGTVTIGSESTADGSPLEIAASYLAVDPAAIEQALTMASISSRTQSGVVTTVAPIVSLRVATSRLSEVMAEVYGRCLRFIEDRVALQLAPLGQSKLEGPDPSSTITLLHAPSFSVSCTTRSLAGSWDIGFIHRIVRLVFRYSIDCL
jgi:hypothetical protein